MKALLIPIYEPTDRVVPFLKQFQKEDFDAFLVVNDGSGERYDAIFKQIEEETIFPVIGYDVNYGKGYALKHGMRHLIKQHPDLDYIVTADGDGQHLRQDILKVSDYNLQILSPAIPCSIDQGTLFRQINRNNAIQFPTEKSR